MPLHRFFVPTGLYTPEDKAAISEAITQLYSNPPTSLPQFYVVVLFIELEKGNFFNGGKATDGMARITIEHVARNFAADDAARKRGFMDRYEQVIAPFTKNRGINWEVTVVDTDPLLWNINGIAPPQGNTEAEALWRRENKAVPFEKSQL
ncbi:putative oxalocrotonate tautomerase [Mycena metata]|uniref:Oxalocrotonate tautomerase n=1 Tax=Mycena metata TaxID=1033252 RepID=A0AAD7K789_9AGAR|nr:putative oxalocrotonate tautomerase [Mycena metata]